MSKTEEVLVKTATQFDVHKWSDYPEVNSVVDALFNEIKSLRQSKKIQIRRAEKVKKAIKVIVIDLWVANKLSSNPYRAIAKNKTDYQKENRYKKIFIKYDYFINVVNDLIELKYIDQKLGFYLKENPNASRRTRIKALPKLLNKILNPLYGVDELVKNKGYMALNQYNPEFVSETIILRDKDSEGKKIQIDYIDNTDTHLMRANLNFLNKKLQKTRIALQISDWQYVEMLQRLKSKKNPNPTIDFSRTSMHRVFNNGSFDQGGRFYGGWWQSIPRDYRKYITINYKETVELDYSGHHLRILYAQEKLAPPDDPYDIPLFSREDQKTACLIMINAADKEESVNAMHGKGIKNSERIIAAIEKRHSAISKYFFSEEGNKLMNKDSILAERVMLRMLEKGATVLPVHDSFIVRNSYQEELKQVMEEEFEKAFNGYARLKPKMTVFEELSECNKEKNKEEFLFVTDDLKELHKKISWESTIWGF